MNTKQIFSWIAVLCMIVSLLSVSAFASETATIVTTERELVAALAAGGTVKLGADITTTSPEEDDIYTYIMTGADAVLDLNGYTITPAPYMSDTYVILLCGDMTITDTSESGNGKIYANEGGYLSAEYTYIEGEGWTDAPTITIKGGTVTNLAVGDDTSVIVEGGNVKLYLYQPDYFYEEEEYSSYLSSITFKGITADNLNLPEGYTLKENSDGTLGIADAAVAEINGVQYATLQEAVDAANSGDTIKLLADAALNNTLDITKSVTIDGNGFKLVPADANATYNSAIMAGSSGWGDANNTVCIKLKNLEISGWNATYGAIRVQGVTFEMDNCSVKNNKSSNVSYGILTLTFANSNISNTEFTNNEAAKVIDVNSNGDNSAANIAIDNCSFTENTASSAGIILYSDGKSISVTNSEFVNNTVNTTGNAATLYFGFNDECVATGNLFKNNTVTTTNTTTKRLAGAIFCDCGVVINNNVFDGNTSTRSDGTKGATGIANSAYYTSFGPIDINNNYWGTSSTPALGTEYTVEYGKEPVEVTTYYTSYNIENDEIVFGEMVEVAEAVATVNGIEYSDLQEAINAANPGDTVTLISDLTIESDLADAGKGYFNIAEDDKIILDLGGKTINVTDNSAGNFIVFYNYGDLTIKNGNVNLTATIDRDWNAQSTIILNRGGNLNIESGTYTHKGGTDMAITVDNSGNSFGDAYMTVIDGQIISDNYTAIRMRMADTTLNGDPGNGLVYLTVNGGKISGASRGIWGQITNASADALGGLTVTSGTIAGGKYALAMTSDTHENIDIAISGEAVINGVVTGDANDYAITGGTFTTDVSDYVADGHKLVSNTDGTYGVEEAPTAVAKIGNKEYATFTEALTAAVAGDEIVLLANVALEESIMIQKAITINGNGFSITPADATKSYNSAIYFDNVASATIKNTVFDGWKSSHVIRIQGVANAKIDAVTIKNSNQTEGLALISSTFSNTEITNSTFVDNRCIEVIDINSWGDTSTHTAKVIGNTFSNNTATNTGIIYYAVGGGFELTNNTFTNNTVNANTGHGSVVYFSEGANSAVRGNTFEGNAVIASGKRAGGALVLEAGTVVEDNAFINNTASSAEFAAQVLYKADSDAAAINLSKNYWGGNEPDAEDYASVKGAPIEIASYYAARNNDGALSELIELNTAVPVAKIGNKEYNTLAAAFAAAEKGDTIVLLSDIELAETITIAADEEIILDLNEKTITATDNNSEGNFFLFDNYGKFTIKNGTINLTAVTDRSWSAASAVIQNRGGELVIESGSYNHLGGTAMAYVVDNNANSFGDAKTTVLNGNLTSAYIVIRNRMDTYGANGGGNGKATLVVNGGKFEGKYAIWGQVSSPGVQGSIEITDGTFTSITGKAPVIVDADATGNASTAISGGTFSAACDESYLADGFEFKENSNGTYGVEEKEPEIELFNIYATRMILGNSLNMQFIFSNQTYSNWNGFYAVITKEYADRAPISKTVPYSEWGTLKIGNANYFTATFDDIAAKEMSDKISIVVYNADGVAVSNSATDSVKGYAARAIGNTAVSQEVWTMLTDMLNYGAAAQISFNYATDNLANSNITGEYASEAKEYNKYTSLEGANGYIYGTRLMLNNKILLELMLMKNKIADGSYMVINFKDHYGKDITKTITKNDMYVSGDFLVATIDDLVVADCRQLVTCKLYDGTSDEPLVTLIESIESYAVRSGMSELYEAIMKFSDSAYAYFH